ncbi:MAG: hypothetical protein U0L49_05855 [Eubacterium sp.]|nr:hypothetical protein [Eubacterium sp.]
MKIKLNKLLKIAGSIGKSISHADFSKIPKALRTLDSKTLRSLIAAAFSGAAAGYLSRQPKVNKLQKANRAAQTENETLQSMVRSFHEIFIKQKLEIEGLKIQQTEEYMKKNTDITSIVTVQYAAKEYMMLSKHISSVGKDDISEEQLTFYRTFKKVVDNGSLNDEDLKIIQDYTYPKYKDEIDSLTECDFGELLDT